MFNILLKRAARTPPGLHDGAKASRLLEADLLMFICFLKVLHVGLERKYNMGIHKNISNINYGKAAKIALNESEMHANLLQN